MFRQSRLMIPLKRLFLAHTVGHLCRFQMYIGLSYKCMPLGPLTVKDCERSKSSYALIVLKMGSFFSFGTSANTKMAPPSQLQQSKTETVNIPSSLNCKCTSLRLEGVSVESDYKYTPKGCTYNSDPTVPIYHRPTTLSSVIDRDLDATLTEIASKQGCDSPV